MFLILSVRMNDTILATIHWTLKILRFTFLKNEGAIFKPEKITKEYSLMGILSRYKRAREAFLKPVHCASMVVE